MSSDLVTVTVKWAVYADGEQHSGGSTLQVPPDHAEQWTAQGWVQPAATAKAAQRRPRAVSCPRRRRRVGRGSRR